MLFEVEVVDVPVVGSDEDVAVVVSVDGAEPDVMAMDEATEDTGEEAIDVTPFGEATVYNSSLSRGTARRIRGRLHWQQWGVGQKW